VVVLHLSIQREQVLRQGADPLTAVPDRAFGGTNELGDAGVGVTVGSQTDNLRLGLQCVLEAVQRAAQ
jgi:hypothetical protein